MADLTTFNAAPAGEAERDLRAACESTAFAAAMLAGRPYQDGPSLLAAIDAAFAAMSWGDVLDAMNAHPPVGAPAAGISAAEQSGVADADRQALAAGNAAYQRRFGHIFLIRASGRTGAEMVADLHIRLKNDETAERRVVTRELRDITRLRMAKLLGL